MSDAPAAWIDAVRDLAERAPEWMRERAAAELHIGGFTQAQLETPVLEVSDLDDTDAAQCATVFFLAVALAAGASIARVHCAPTAAAGLVAASREALGAAIHHVDDENVSLMRYFDVSLETTHTLTSDDAARLVAALERATQG